MKYNELTKQQIEYLQKQGLSGRGIAKELDISKSGVNDYLKKLRQGDTLKKGNGSRRLFIDIETAVPIVAAFNRYDVTISEDHVIIPGDWILSISWAFDQCNSGEIMAFTVGLSPEEIANQDDSRLVALLYELYENADEVVAHNGKKFDFKVIQARAIANNFGVMPTAKFVDTLQMAKSKIKVPSFSLDSLCNYFGLGRKSSSGGIQTWLRVQSGDKLAMQNMLDYNLDDVKLLVKLYEKIKCLGAAGVNQGLYFDDQEIHCKSCGSTHVVETGREVATVSNLFKEVECQECGAKARLKTSLTNKEKRKVLLA